jgi:predicted ribosome quality control (RQC) complex YloA/Tae2 family protein
MERAVAIKKLGKLLGKSLGYQVRADAPTAEERAQATEEAKALNAEYKVAEEAEAARRRAILEGDAEYQRLRAETKRLRDAKDMAWSVSRRFKITVGRSNSMFFSVEAEGDSWEDVIEQIERKRERVAA